MESIALEWMNLLLRWVHVIAAIMWIGDSFLFMWMDSSLMAPTRPREGAVAGELWLVHSGGFYEVVKRRFLAPHELPESLHWFKWEAYTTWVSGFFLLGVVYYWGAGLYLVKGAATPTGVAWTIALSLGLLAAAWLVYDGLWNSPLTRRPRFATLLSLLLIVATAYGLTRWFSGRAAYIQMGAMLGTIMAANVWRRIIPAQRQMLAATKAATPVDVSLGERAKKRSIHNHYLTLPVLVAMLSNHFPSTYGHPLNWVVLLLLMGIGAVAKYVMNFRRRSRPLIVFGGTAALVAVVALTLRVPAAPSGNAGLAATIPFETAHAIIERRCLSCHSAQPSNPSFPQPPNGITLEDPQRIRRLADRIKVRAVVTKTMPLGNLTGMTEAERETLGAWIVQGAHVTP